MLLRHLAAFLIGMAEVVVVTTVFFGGDVGSAVGLLLASIVCTLGLSVIIWLPLFWGLGFVTITVIERFRPVPGQPAHVAASAQDAQFVTHYVQQALNQGVPPDQVARRLRHGGWSEQEIARGLAAANPPGGHR